MIIARCQQRPDFGCDWHFLASTGDDGDVRFAPNVVLGAIFSLLAITSITQRHQQGTTTAHVTLKIGLRLCIVDYRVGLISRVNTSGSKVRSDRLPDSKATRPPKTSAQILAPRVDLATVCY